MRIALFSDVHGNLTALNAVLAALDRHRPLQMLVAAGDHVLARSRPAETWDALMAAGCLCILGNEDARLWDASLEPTQPDSPWSPLVAVQAPWTAAALGPARLAALRADTPDDDLARLYGGADARVVCCGHFHTACVREWGGTTLVNVASVSLATDGLPAAGYTILNWDGAWQIAQYRVPYDADAEATAMAASSLPQSVPGWSPPAAR
jgi:putative phosphoesterase